MEKVKSYLEQLYLTRKLVKESLAGLEVVPGADREADTILERTNVREKNCIDVLKIKFNKQKIAKKKT